MRKTGMLAAVGALAALQLLAAAGPAAASTAPTVTAVAPTSGRTAGGTRVTVYGSGFTHISAVHFGTLSGSSITVVSSTRLTVIAPAHGAGTVDVRVVTTHGTSATHLADHYTYVLPPAITAVSPNSGRTAGGTRLTITGSNFRHVTTVKFGTVSGTSLYVASTTKLAITAPAHAAGVVAIRVTMIYGTSALVTADHYTFVAPPVVTAVAPVSGSTAGGTRVTLTGANFIHVASVRFGGTVGTALLVASATKLAVTAPPRTAGLVAVQVFTAYGTSALVSADHFTYVEAPVSSVHVTGSTLTSLTLSWTRPATPDYAGVMIRRARGTVAPTSPSSGALVADVPTPATSLTDNGLDPGTAYTYSFFAHDHTPVYAPAVPLSAATLGGRINGLVTDSAAHPLVNADVVITTADGVLYSGATAPDGSYSIGVPAGTSTVCFTAHHATGGANDATGYVSACYDSVAYDQAPTPVDVAEGATTPGINIALVDGGAITGVVDDSASHPLVGVSVTVTSPNGDRLTVITGADGSFSATGVAPGTATACFVSNGASGGSSDATGYVDSCYDAAPAGGTPTDVAVTADTVTSGINAALAAAGAVSGVATDSANHPLTGVIVTVTAADGATSTTATASDGTYRLARLAPGSATICFSGPDATGGTSDATGYLDACYANITPGGNPTPVTITGSSETPGISQQLSAAGAITGVITVAVGESLADIQVDVYNQADGSPVRSVSPGTSTYRVTALPPGSYSVCFTDVADGNTTCYQNAADPTRATPVSVTAGTTTASIDGTLS